MVADTNQTHLPCAWLAHGPRAASRRCGAARSGWKQGAKTGAEIGCNLPATPRTPSRGEVRVTWVHHGRDR